MIDHTASEDRALAVLLDIAEDTDLASVEERIQAAGSVLQHFESKELQAGFAAEREQLAKVPK